MTILKYFKYIQPISGVKHTILTSMGCSKLFDVLSWSHFMTVIKKWLKYGAGHWGKYREPTPKLICALIE